MCGPWDWIQPPRFPEAGGSARSERQLMGVASLPRADGSFPAISWTARAAGSRRLGRGDTRRGSRGSPSSTAQPERAKPTSSSHPIGCGRVISHSCRPRAAVRSSTRVRVLGSLEVRGASSRHQHQRGWMDTGHLKDGTLAAHALPSDRATETYGDR